MPEAWSPWTLKDREVLKVVRAEACVAGPVRRHSVVLQVDPQAAVREDRVAADRVSRSVEYDDTLAMALLRRTRGRADVVRDDVSAPGAVPPIVLLFPAMATPAPLFKVKPLPRGPEPASSIPIRLPWTTLEALARGLRKTP